MIQREMFSYIIKLINNIFQFVMMIGMIWMPVSSAGQNIIGAKVYWPSPVISMRSWHGSTATSHEIYVASHRFIIKLRHLTIIWNLRAPIIFWLMLSIECWDIHLVHRHRDNNKFMCFSRQNQEHKFFYVHCNMK